MFAKISAIVSIVGALLGGGAQVAPVEAKMAVETVVNAHWADNSEYTAIWVENELETAGVVVPENVSIIVTDTDNCGSELSPEGTGGGCTVYFHDGTTSVLVSPSALENGTGAHILFHELGHALHHMDECSAEYFAHKYSDVDQWSYPSCEER